MVVENENAISTCLFGFISKGNGLLRYVDNVLIYAKYVFDKDITS